MNTPANKTYTGISLFALTFSCVYLAACSNQRGLSVKLKGGLGALEKTLDNQGAAGNSNDGTGGSLTKEPVCTQDEPSSRHIWRLSREQYVNTLVASFGDTTSAKATLQLLPTDGIVNGYDNNFRSLFIGDELARSIRSHAERLSSAVADNAVNANACLKNASVTDGCLNQVVLALGQKAFRRPLSGDEKNRYFNFVKSELQASSPNLALNL